MFDNEAYLLAEIKSSEKNFAIKSSIFPPKFISIKHMLRWLMTSFFMAQ